MTYGKNFNNYGMTNNENSIWNGSLLTTKICLAVSQIRQRLGVCCDHRLTFNICNVALVNISWHDMERTSLTIFELYFNKHGQCKHFHSYMKVNTGHFYHKIYDETIDQKRHIPVCIEILTLILNFISIY